MASVYGQVISGTDGKGNRRSFKAYGAYTVTANNDTTYSVNVVSGVANNTANAMAWAYANWCQWSMSGDITVANAKNTAKLEVAGNARKQLITTRTLTVTKTHVAQTKTINCIFEGLSPSPWAGKSTAVITLTIPAKTSYAVTYNANGGSGAPSTQTKWYDEALTLSSTVPARTGYNFVGWATSAKGAVAYAPGASYTANASVTLYAVWKSAYTQMSFGNSATVRRYDGTALADDGTQAQLTFSWTNGKAYATVSDTTGTTLPLKATIKYRQSGASAWTTAVNAESLTANSSKTWTLGSSGTFDINYTYDIQITLADSMTSISKIVRLSAAFFLMDVSADGRCIGFGTVAEDNVTSPKMLLGMDVESTENVTVQKAITAGAVKSYTPTWGSGETGLHWHCVVSAGICHLQYQGQAKAHAANALLFTLPVGARPMQQIPVPFVKNANTYGVIAIESTGAVTVTQISSTTNSGRIYFNCSYPVVDTI